MVHPSRVTEGIMPSQAQGHDCTFVVPRTKVERAQNIMYETWGASCGKKRVDAVRCALEISPDCADAYVLLAGGTAKSMRERARPYEQGVRAGGPVRLGVSVARIICTVWADRFRGAITEERQNVVSESPRHTGGSGPAVATRASVAGSGRGRTGSVGTAATHVAPTSHRPRRSILATR